MIQDHCELFTSFSPSAFRLDTLMLDTMSINDTYSKLWKVVKMLLVLPHGQLSYSGSRLQYEQAGRN